jgi:hypothetical protein
VRASQRSDESASSSDESASSSDESASSSNESASSSDESASSGDESAVDDERVSALASDNGIDEGGLRPSMAAVMRAIACGGALGPRRRAQKRMASSSDSDSD